jgi:hypothetical protein
MCVLCCSTRDQPWYVRTYVRTRVRAYVQVYVRTTYVPVVRHVYGNNTYTVLLSTIGTYLAWYHGTMVPRDQRYAIPWYGTTMVPVHSCSTLIVRTKWYVRTTCVPTTSAVTLASQLPVCHRQQWSRGNGIVRTRQRTRVRVRTRVRTVH